MFFWDIASPTTVLLLLGATILLIILGTELKRSYITAIPLFGYLILLVSHVISLMTLPITYSYLSSTLMVCILIDFAFIAMTFLSYLWVDDLEAKKYNKKSIDNSLDWFWKEV